MAIGRLGASRDAWIARSKIVLNVHYWEAKIFEIARVSYLLANRRAVVSERGADPTLERDLESGIAFADYDELVDRCVELLGDERARRELAERGYQAFSARDQAAIVDRALSEASRMSPTRPLRATTLASMCASKTKTTAQITPSSATATCSGISLSRNAISCWPRSNATPRMRGRSFS